jgi:hypothetical protein
MMAEPSAERMSEMWTIFSQDSHTSTLSRLKAYFK